MKHRVLILPVSAAVIFGLVVWRMNRESQQRTVPTSHTAVRRLAPRFELYDQHSQLVKFERYLGRTRLLLLFIGEVSAAEDPLVRQLLDQHADIEAADVQIVVIGLATPFANREAEKRLSTQFPFPVLTDVDLQSPEPAPVHRLWGLAGDDTTDVRQGLFLIDRDGTVVSSPVTPQPVNSPDQTIKAIVGGQWLMSLDANRLSDSSRD